MKLPSLPRPVYAWAMYDFANSAFATVVLSVIFNVYFARVVVPPEGVRWAGMTIPGESLWGYLISLVMLLVLVLSPLLGALADKRSLKRAFLVFWATVGALSTVGLASAAPGRVAPTAVLLLLAALGFEMSLVFYNAFLKDVSDDSNAGRVSGLGFALGYIGGGLCLALNMALINGTDPARGVRMGMIAVGLWWLVFALPSFIWLRDRPVASAPMGNVIESLKDTLKAVRKIPSMGRFLLAYVIYEDGIQTVIVMASIFGAKELGMTTGQLALCFLFIQFVAFIGAMACGRLADAWGHKRVILLTLFLYMGAISWAVVMKTPAEFWGLGAIVGIVLGGSQAASRSFFARLVPIEKSSEFFALFSIVGKAAAFMGPLVFGIAAQFWGLRAGVASLLVFFVVGGSVLLPVREKPR